MRVRVKVVYTRERGPSGGPGWTLYWSGVSSSHPAFVRRLWGCHEFGANECRLDRVSERMLGMLYAG